MGNAFVPLIFYWQFHEYEQKTSNFITFSKQDNTRINIRDNTKICIEDQDLYQQLIPRPMSAEDQ